MAGKFDNVAELIARNCTRIEIEFGYVEAAAKGNKTEAKIFDTARIIQFILEEQQNIKGN